MSTKSKSIPNPFARKILVACKVNPDEMRSIISKAQAYFGGNISELLREAALAYKRPSKKGGKP